MLPHALPALPYAYAALEPLVDAETMELHHSKHHQAYVTNYTALLAGTGLLEKYPDAQELVRRLAEVPEDKRTGVRNNLGGHVNHALYWDILAPGGAKAPEGALAAAVARDFGSFDSFREKFSDAAKKVFGSGWVFLAKDAAGKLEIVTKPNQDSPLMDAKTPVLGIDVWEHAYYLKHRNRRADYVANFLAALNWTAAGKNY